MLRPSSLRRAATALALTLVLSCAAGESSAAEKYTAGQACSSDQNAFDWDTGWDCVSNAYQRAPFFIGDSTATCDSSHKAMLRFYATTSSLQVCDGSNWVNIAVSSNAATLIITPSSQSSMNVTTSGTPGTGSDVTFTVQNIGSVTSSTISTVLSNTTNFAFGTNNCSGVTLAANATCTVNVHPQAYSDASYSGTLNIVANNNPSASLSGTATGSCGTIGSSMDGGILASCQSGYALIAMPGGCEDSTTPSCAGINDSITKLWSTESVYLGASSASDGRDSGSGNTAVIMARVGVAGAGTYPAAEYCSNVSYGGHTDWYLPAWNELSLLYANKSAIGGFQSTQEYWASTESADGYASAVYFANGNQVWSVYPDTAKSLAPGHPIRCVRRQ